MTRLPHLCRCGLSLLLGSTSVAQGPGVVLADDPVVMRIHGPERIRAAFRATNVSELLGAAESTDFWDLLGAALADDARRLRADAGVIDALVERLDGYSGTATIALVPHRMMGMRLWADGVLVLESDGRTDLAAIARDVRRVMVDAGATTEDVELGGTVFPIVHVGVAAVALPTMAGDRLVVLFGRDLPAFVAARLAGGGTPFEPDAELEAAPVALLVDLRALVERRVLMIPPFAVPGPDSPFAHLSGLASLRELRVLIRPHGPHVEVDVAVRFAAGADRGALGVLISEHVESADVAGLIPPDAPAWFAGRIDAAAFYDACLRANMAGCLGRVVPESVARVREVVDEEFGVDFERDVLARLDGAFVVLERSPDPESADEDGSVLLVARVLEPDRLEAALVSVAESGRFGAAWPPDAGEPPIRGAGDVAYSVHRNAVLLAVGADREKLIREYVTDGPRADAPETWPADVARRWPQAPVGVQGCGALDVRRILAPGAMRRLGGFVPLPAELSAGWADAVGALEPHLHPYRADRAAVFTAWHDLTWRLRLLW